MPKRALIIPFTAKTSPLIITTGQPNGLPNGTQNAPYASALAASGGKKPYSWLKTGGSAWINVDSAGNVTGTPPSPGPATLTATVTDANNTTVAGSWSFTVAPAVVTGPNPIGANMDFGSFGSTRGLAFTQDGVPQSRGFTQSGSIATPVALTGAGWPAADFAVILIEGQHVQSWMVGTWKCGFTGNGNETITKNGSCTVTKTSAPGNPNVTFDLTTTGIAAGQIVGNYVCGFVVTGTSGGATNVYAYIPGYAANAAANQHQTVPLWTNEAIALYGQMAAIRYMQSSNVINNNSTCTSANRNTPNNTIAINGAPGTLERWCQEYFASMSSACAARHWMNIPIGADNTYYASALAGVAPYMNFHGGTGKCPELIVEIGNELWNGAGAGESGALNALANAYNSANPGVLNYDGTVNQVTISYRWLALRLHDLAVAAQTQFTAANVGINGPVRIAFMTQAAPGGWATFIPTVLNFLERQYAGSANQWVHALGADTYVYRNNTKVPGDGTNWEGTSAAPATIQAEWQRNGQYGAFNNYNEGIKLWCIKYGMRFYSYEGVGPGRIDPGEPDSTLAAIGAAIQDPGMNALTVYLAQQKFNAGHDLLVNYSSGVNTGPGTGASPTYCWDNLDTSLEATPSGSPRFQALQSFASGMTPSHRNLISSSTSIPGTEYADNTAAMNSANPTLTQFGGSGIFGPYQYAWLFQVVASNTYNITMNYTGSGTVNVYVDGVQVATGLAVPNGGGTVTLIANQTLIAGFHSLEIGTGSFQNITVSQINFTAVSGPLTQPLLQSSAFTYLGTFLAPSTGNGGNNFANGGNALSVSQDTGGGLYPDGQLYLTGNGAQGNTVGMISIPTRAQIQQGATGNFVTATMSKAPVTIPYTYTNGTLTQPHMGSTLVWNGRLIYQQFSSYSNVPTNTHGAIKLDLSDAATGQLVPGSNTVANMGPLTGTTQLTLRHVNQFMGIVPTEWRSLLGGPCLTGAAVESTLSTGGVTGVSAYVFDPQNVPGEGITGINPIPMRCCLDYFYNGTTPAGWANSLGGASKQIGWNVAFLEPATISAAGVLSGTVPNGQWITVDPNFGSVVTSGGNSNNTVAGAPIGARITALLSGTGAPGSASTWQLSQSPATAVSGNVYVGDIDNGYCGQVDRYCGIIFPSRTRTVAFIGRHGTGPQTYKNPNDNPGGNGGAPYALRMLMFDAAQFVNVLNGSAYPWGPTSGAPTVPYATVDLNTLVPAAAGMAATLNGLANFSAAYYDEAPLNGNPSRIYYVDSQNTTHIHVFEVNH